MRNVFLATILAVSTKAIFAPRLPAQAQDQQCIKGRGCVPASQRSYNACFAQVDSGAVPRSRPSAGAGPRPYARCPDPARE